MISTFDKEYTEELELRALVQKIRDTVTVFDIMRHFGEWDGPDRTKQVACRFHGPDVKPSARVFKDTGLMWCYACTHPRYDAIRYVQMHEEIGFRQAVQLVQSWFGVEVSSGTDLQSEIDIILNGSKKDEIKQFLQMVDDSILPYKGKVPFREYLGWSNFVDEIMNGIMNGELDLKQATDAYQQLKKNMLKARG